MRVDLRSEYFFFERKNRTILQRKRLFLAWPTQVEWDFLLLLDISREEEKVKPTFEEVTTRGEMERENIYTAVRCPFKEIFGEASVFAVVFE